MNEIITILINVLSATMVTDGTTSKNFLPFSGEAKSEYFVGKVIDGGVDTQTYTPTGGQLSARYILEGTDCAGKPCKIFIENNGKFGEEFTTPKIVTDSDTLKFLNTAPLKGKLDMSDGKLTIRIYKCDTPPLPSMETVGAAAMPKEIAPITEMDLPMKNINRDVFSKKTVKLVAKQKDGRGMYTKAINSEIAKLSKQGGGTLSIPAGTWKTGRVTLMSNVCLNLEEGAVLEFSEELKDYLPVVFTRQEGIEIMGPGAFIYANGQKNIALTGKGTVRGPRMEAEMRTLKNGNSVVEKDIDFNAPVSTRIYDGKDGRTFYRPKSFSPINCTGVFVEGVTFERSVLWNVNPVYCEDVIIRGITVNSIGIPASDGIDISSSKNVLIEYSTLNCGDDCFTMKSGRCEDGKRVNKPTENVLIRYCLAKQGHGGITCGSETAGDIKNILLHSCVFDGTRSAFRFKTRRNRGGGTQNIRYENNLLRNINEVVTFDLLGTAQYMGELAQRKPALAITPLTPVVKDVNISNFVVESSDRFITINGIPEIPCANVNISDATINTNMFIKNMRDADGVHFKNLKVTATAQPQEIDNCKNITYENCEFTYPSAEEK